MYVLFHMRIENLLKGPAWIELSFSEVQTSYDFDLL